MYVLCSMFRKAGSTIFVKLKSGYGPMAMDLCIKYLFVCLFESNNKDSKFYEKIQNGRLDQHAISVMVRDGAKRTKFFIKKFKMADFTKMLSQFCHFLKKGSYLGNGNR